MKAKSKFRGSLRSAFSLIEMLVVIAVILLLARLLMPGLDRAREIGNKVQCASNLKQLGVALQLYTYDNGVYPYSAAGGGRGVWDWINVSQWNATLPHRSCAPVNGNQGTVLGKYANPSGKPCTKSVYWCPSFTGGCKMPYMYYGTLSGNKPRDLKYPGATYMIMDEKEGYEDTLPYVESTSLCSSPCGGSSRCQDSDCSDGNLFCGCTRAEMASGRHNGAGNALFTDGHVISALNGKLTFDMQNKLGCGDTGQGGDLNNFNGPATLH